MKKLMYGAFIALAVVGCKQEKKDFVTFSGKIENKNSDKLTIFNPQDGYKKEISVSEDGTFKDTLKVKNGFFFVSDGAERTNLYLQNGDDIKMTLDTKQFDETVTFTGNGAEESNVLAKIALAQESIMDDKDIFNLSKADFEAKINTYVNNVTSDLKNDKLDTAFVSMQQKGINGFKGYLDKMYAEKQYLATTLAKGKPSPKFTDYENFKGGTTSLDDLKGKFVYIDVWATWCNPCKQQIPFLQKVEKQYHGKNIEFVSISVDDAKAHDAWKKMVAEKELGGIQLFADKSWGSDFIKGYVINGIPRFILIDPQGNVVSPDAPRPSDPKLIELFNSLKI